MPTLPERQADLWVALSQLQAKRVVFPILAEEMSRGFFPNICTVPKPNMALDLKSLNRYMHVSKFCTESTRSVIALRSVEFLVSVDIYGAYLHISIFPTHQCFLCFSVWDQHNQFVSLPHKNAWPVPGPAKKSGHPCHRVPRWSSAERCLSYGLAFQHPKRIGLCLIHFIAETLSFGFLVV